MGADTQRLSAHRLVMAVFVAVVTVVSAEITASPAVPGGQPGRLVIDGVPPLLSVGTSVRPVVYLRDATGARVDVTASAIWTSSNVAVAAVEKGEVLAIAAGDARITAVWGNVGGTVAVRVIVGPVPEPVGVTPAEPERPEPRADPPARNQPTASAGGIVGTGPTSSGSAPAPTAVGTGMPAQARPSPEGWRDLGSTLVSAVWADFSLSSGPAAARATELHLGRATVYATWLVVGLTLLVGGLARGGGSQARVAGALLAVCGAILGVVAPGLARLPGVLFDIVAVLTVLTLLVVAQLAFSLGGFRWRDPVARRSLVILIWFALGFAAAFAWAVWSLMRNPLRVP